MGFSNTESSKYKGRLNMHIGFIGLGNMGIGMATNILRKGHKLTVFDLRKKAAEPLLEAGASWAETPKAVAKASKITFTSLPGPKEVDQVALGKNGIIEGIRSGDIYVDLSTNSLKGIHNLYDKFKEKGAHMMDVPINDGMHESIEAKLMLMASGDEDIYKRVKPVLDCMGDKVRYFGKIGSGTICKIVHNSLSFGIQTVVAEGFSLGVKAGIDRDNLLWVIANAAVGHGVLFHFLMPQVYLPKKFDPAHFALKLGYKDVDLATSLGREYNVPMPLINLAQQELLSALNRGWGDKDATMAMQLQEERAGLLDSNVPTTESQPDDGSK
jgi:3-hydroxyisobutyrate dehydrogenase-like beta-hydroxyacid dehydrogenase